MAQRAQRVFQGEMDRRDGVKITLPEGWVHLRRSNTEPIVRAIAESKDAEKAAELVERALRSFDETQQVARAYGAVCTPDLFVFDGERRLVYRGQFDDSRPGNGRPVTGVDLRRAVDAVLAGGAVPEPQVPSVGCNIKWKPGTAPQ